MPDCSEIPWNELAFPTVSWALRQFASEFEAGRLSLAAAADTGGAGDSDVDGGAGAPASFASTAVVAESGNPVALFSADGTLAEDIWWAPGSKGWHSQGSWRDEGRPDS